MQRRDMAAAQAALHSSGLWHDDYALPAACVVILLVYWYWQSASRRHVFRMCDAAEHRTIDECESLRARVDSMRKKWEAEMKAKQREVREVQEANSGLARSIDQMTTALKACTPRSYGGN